MKVLITNAAFGDLEAINQYYLEEDVPHLGAKFTSKIMDHIQTLKSHPDIGRQVPEFNTPSIRELIHSPYRIVYLREKSIVHIIRVWRSERRLVLPYEV
ncbi:MAG: type II toxin-antitoxin system RelE/ParE family toxin [Gammaproteobacteria bacterium]|nr:type II toxin-antitoxin system RelE/ParE family toxin [Gammaproteobacteria bacterium]